MSFEEHDSCYKYVIITFLILDCVRVYEKIF